MRLSGQRGFLIEPLDPAKHDRESFHSGVSPVDRFLRMSANKLSRADNIRVFVMVEPERLIGFYAVNAHSVDYEQLPARYARSRPGHGAVPAAFISMIGVDARFQGQGHGAILLMDCFRRVVRAAELLGIAVVMLDILNCGDPVAVERRKALYLRYGFEPLTKTQGRLFLPIATARAVVGNSM